MGRTQRRRAAPQSQQRGRRRRSQHSKLFLCAKVIDQDGDGVSLARLSVHGTHLEKRLARGNPGINRLDRIAKAHHIDYGKAKDLKDK